MTITAPAARMLRALLSRTAGALTQAVEEAARHIVATGCDPPGWRPSLAGWVNFGIMAGEPLIAAVGSQGGKGERHKTATIGGQRDVRDNWRDHQAAP